MESASELGFASVAQLSDLLASGNMSPGELAEDIANHIRHVDAIEGATNSVLALVADPAAVAEKATSGPLRGIPVLIKDNIQAVGLPGTAGSLALAGRPVTHDADLVARLRAAGAVVVGSTNLSEWANMRSPKSTSGWSAVGGLTRNPWDLSRSAGGSSSGSGAALAAGLAPLAVGTETDGSIVCPAALNGVVGIKPTVGRVSTRGVVPISASQDSPGPMARSVADTAALLDVLVGTDSSSALSDTSPLRVGVVRQWLTGDDETNTLFHAAVDALARAGVTVVQIDVPEATDEADQDEVLVLVSELLEDMATYLVGRSSDGVQNLADVIAFNLAHSDEELAHFGQEHFERAIASGGRTDDYHQARERNLQWATREVLAPALHDVDVVIGCLYGPAWPIALGQGDDFGSASWMTTAPAVAGWPIGSVPMGLCRSTGSALPVGLGVAARRNDEVGLVRAMARIEQVLGPIR